MDFPRLNFPAFTFRTRDKDGVVQIYDTFRRTWLVLTPEEWVRRNFLNWLTECFGVLPEQIMQECPVLLEGMPQRADIAVYGRNARLMMIVECKSWEVPLERSGATGDAERKKTFAQAVRYNSVMKAPYVAITNGLAHYCFSFDEATGEYVQLPEFPELAVK